MGQVSDHVRCYARRRLNPFMGVLQIIETGGGRAISANGIVWDIEVMAKLPRSQLSQMSNTPQQAYYRYGLWSEADGLVNRPLAPHLETDPLTQQSEVLIQLIRQHTANLPFTLIDDIELWLFDADAQYPLVLLASLLPHQPRPSPEPRRWTGCMGAEGVPSQRRFTDITQLEEQVKQRAGFNQQRIWIQRHGDGTGYSMTDNAMQYAADIFPPCLIQEEAWSDSLQQQRVKKYIQWIAPSLLTLQRLSREQRHSLETQLHVQAVSVEHHWHLYPEVIEASLLQAARVQCQIQLSQQ